MQQVRWFWLGATALNIMWLLLLPSRSGKAVAALGSGIALVILGGTFSGGVGRALASAVTPAVSHRNARLVALLGVFLLPCTSFYATPRLAFWSLDGRAWLILGWVAITALGAYEAHVSSLERSPQEDGRFEHVAIALYIACVSCLWLTLIWDLGVGHQVMNTNRTANRLCQPYDVLTTIVSIWESEPASSHLYLAWRSPESYQTRTVYANHVHPYLFAMYGWIAAVRAATGSALHVASNTTPFLYAAVLMASIGVLLARMGLLRQRGGPLQLLILFIGVGFVLTTWRFWNDLYRYNRDNPYPLLAAVLALVYAFLLTPPRPVLAALAASLVVALSPIHAPMLVLAVALLFGQSGDGLRQLWARNRVVIVVSGCSLLVGAIVVAIPRALIAWKGYTPISSSFLFRSGLDGDMTYFTSIMQAAVQPCAVNCCYARTPADLALPAFLPLAAFIPWLVRDRRDRELQLGRLLLFLCTPYVVSLVLFPQSVSIHPYLYDHLLIVPVVVAGTVAMLAEPVRARLARGGLLLFLFFMGWIIMSNLISLAQGLGRMP